MSEDVLQAIQAMQFTDKGQAEQKLLVLVRELFSLNVVQVELRPLAVSLNSFNGFLRLSDGQRLFFKTHTEPDSIIGEYYNSMVLADAGYPVIQPVYTSTEAGKQLLIYEVIDDPSVFDLAWSIETDRQDALPVLTNAQHRADHDLFSFYLNTLDWQTADEAAQARIHQLFFHRLAHGRLERFYGPLPGEPGEDVTIILPQGAYSMSHVRQVRWVINGQHYDLTLDDLIVQALNDMAPAQAGPSVIGHGDAHNGNVFYRARANILTYFDPAFAGRHHPLLDLAKPLFHNGFAMWMYFPHEKAAQTKISLRHDGDIWHVQHDYQLHSVRHMFLESKVRRVLLPILRELERHSWFDSNWRRYLKSALFCCPFLTMNLADQRKFPPEISLLGLTMAVEMGAESQCKRSLIDRTLDQIEEQLSL